MVASSGSGGSHDPGDLGRRVADRRRELQLDPEELARRAGMAPAYVSYLEEHPAVGISTGSLLRLAAALDMPADALAGGGQERPPGGGPPGVRPVLEPLSRAQCDGLLGPGGVGRIVFVTERRPVAVPVNFRLLDGDVVFRTAADTFVAEGAEGRPVGFEVDHLDEAQSEGWSVLVTGWARPVIPAELHKVEELGLQPWAGGDRDLYLRVVPEEVSGRRIRTIR